MRKYRSVILGVLILSMMVAMFSSCASSRKTRPITITVLDEETDEPITDVKVYYGLEERKLEFTLINLFPLGGPSYKYYYTLKLKRTDKNGIVHFNAMNKLDKEHENLESIFINLNIEKDYWKAVVYNSKIPISNDNYFGFYISNSKQCFEAKNINNWGFQPVDGIDVLINGGSLNKENEQLTIALRKIDTILLR